MTQPETPERRHGDPRRQRLETRMTDLTIGVVGMKGAMEGLSRALQTEVDDLKRQNVKQRRLSKYNRRTHFLVLGYVLVVGLMVSDLGRRYCGAAGEQVDGVAGQVCNAAFWTTEHGGGLSYRVLGFAVQVAFLVFMWRRSQVPADLYDEVAAAQVKRESRFRWLGRAS